MKIIRSTCLWASFKFTVYDPDDDWPEVGGLYVFAHLRKDCQEVRPWQPVYVGRTKNFGNRLPTHKKWPEAQKRGATHIHIRIEKKKHVRRRIEKKLIDLYQPVLNVQNRKKKKRRKT